MDFPLKEEFELKIKIKKKFLFFKWNKNLIIKYKQASVLECIEFLKYSDRIQDYYLWFIETHSNIKKSEIVYILYNFKDIWQKLQNTFFKWYFKKMEWWTEEVMPFNAYITLICEKLSIEPLKLLDYTIEQLQWITKWIIYNNQSEEDRIREARKQEREKEFSDMTEDEQKRIKDFLQSND